MCVHNTGKIELLGMRFHAFHGCLPSERENGGDYLVDFSCSVNPETAIQTDELEDTLDYSAVYKIVAEEMTIPSNLLEHVAGRIRDAIEEAFPELEEFEISISKLAPPVGGPAECARVTLKGGCNV